MNTEERFWSKVDKAGKCWVWTAGKDTAGYGQFRFEGKNTKAHRVSYFLEHGHWPQIARHSCDNPPCVNPEHLVDGSYKDRRGGVKKSMVEEIRKIPMSRTIIADVSTKYGVSEATARSILDGTVWNRLPGARKIVRQKSRSKLSISDILEIKEALKTPYWGQVNALAAQYGVNHSQISHIKSGLIHSDVHESIYSVKN